MAGSSSQQAVVTGMGDPERVGISRTTWQLPQVFGVTPALGRWYTDEEDTPGGPKTVVLSHGYWTTRFGGARDVLGQTMTIDGEPHEIIGVMPAGFSHRGASFFLPVQNAVDPSQRNNHWLATYARLRPHVTLEQAQQEMRALGDRLMDEYGHNHGIDVASYRERVVGNVAAPLRVLMGGVSLVLLIACTNVANLLLASGLARRRELAVRSALGATRWDLTRQLTLESVVLAMVGGGVGLLLAQWAIRTFLALAEGVLPRASAVGIDTSVLLFAAGLSVLTGILCGLWPVVRLSRRSIGGDIREGDLRSGSAAGGRRFGNGLVVVEVALAFCLLAGAGLLIRNLLALEARHTGFETERRIAFDIAPSGPRYDGPDSSRILYRELQTRLSALPGVERVGSTSHLPMYQFGWNGEAFLQGGNPWPDDEAPLIEFRWVAGDYFDAMGIDLLAGRPFDDRDREGSQPVTVVSRRTAEKFWPGEHPIGRRFSRGSADNTPYEVVGLVDDVRTRGLVNESPFEMYIPVEQEVFQWQTYVLRTASADSSGVMPSVRALVGEIDPSLPVSQIQTLDDVVAGSVDQPRLISALASLFGGLAAILAAVGVYGVMAYNVRRQRREYGIRLALGADPAGVSRIVVGRGLVLGGLGVAIGVGASLLLTRFIQALLNDVAATDPAVYVACAIGLLGVTVLAGYLPARMASRTDPMIVLRTE
jgi:predicted permease